MNSRKVTFAALTAILITALLGAGVSARLGAVSVAVTNFRGAWTATASYGTGAVVAFDGAGYIPPTHRDT
jgi:hypothetical protein